jgi:V/A-type H+-transporting ATPase subunit K
MLWEFTLFGIESTKFINCNKSNLGTINSKFGTIYFNMMNNNICLMKVKKLQSIAIMLSVIITLLSIRLTTALGLSQDNLTHIGFTDNAGKFIGAGLAVGLAGLGSSIGMGNASAAAIGAISEDEGLFGTTLIFVVLIEAVAIYGLLVALLLIFAV